MPSANPPTRSPSRRQSPLTRRVSSHKLSGDQSITTAILAFLRQVPIPSSCACQMSISSMRTRPAIPPRSLLSSLSMAFSRRISLHSTTCGLPNHGTSSMRQSLTESSGRARTNRSLAIPQKSCSILSLRRWLTDPIAPLLSESATSPTNTAAAR